MPDEIEVPLEHAHEQIAEAHHAAHEEAHHAAHGEGEGHGGSDDQKEHQGWIRLVAVVTALLAVVAAIGSLKAGLLVNEALLSKNDEISLRTQAADQWNYYQSKSIKGIVYETTAQLLPPGSPLIRKGQAEAAKLAVQQKAIMAKAKGFDESADDKKVESDRDMEKHHIFAFSVSLCQIAIALSAIAALTRSRRVWVFSLAAGLAGAAALIGGFLGFNLPFAF